MATDIGVSEQRTFKWTGHAVVGLKLRPESHAKKAKR
jgi:hypothetical protein